MSKALISLKNINVQYTITKGNLLNKTSFQLKAVNDIDLDIFEGETLGLVGESGCGKSTLGKTILQLEANAKGSVYFDGENISILTDRQLREKRKNFQMIFQDPASSLNPRMTIGSIIGEPLSTFKLFKGKELKEKVIELMEKVGLRSSFIRRYPHEFSGGQQQRIGIARAIALNPKFIVADEPISALDVSIQAQIINLLMDLQKELDLTYLFISHDLSAVKHISDRIAVMYLGKIVELADYKNIYDNPLHPYTEALISAIPIPDPALEKKRELILLNGEIPSPLNIPSGCSFHNRCPKKFDLCKTKTPELIKISNGHSVACHLHDKET
ncbi:MAG: oligopeptide/dipeptide ABC transporter ATP-binding protein [Pseudomonadota bacterium]